MHYKKQQKETPYDEFVKAVQKIGVVTASTSHENRNPSISPFAILEWQFDSAKNVLFSITKTGKRVECSTRMPAFHIYDLVD